MVISALDRLLLRSSFIAGLSLKLAHPICHQRGVVTSINHQRSLNFFEKPKSFCTSIFNPSLKSSRAEMSTSTSSELVSVDFEVFGKVQGVFFRKYTQAKGNELGLRGWCRNTREGTVQGVMEGPRRNINEMKQWLSKQGSPSSRISKAEFGPEKLIGEFTHEKFAITK